MLNALRLVTLGLVVASCGTAKNSNCSACGPGTLCDTNTGQCVAKNVQGVQCSPSCGGTRPICDAQTNPQNPHCVQCMNDAQCNNGTCSSSSQTCISGAGGGSGGSGAGTGTGGGTTSGTGGGSEDTGGGSGGNAGGTGGAAGGFAVTGDAGTYTGVGSCAPQDAGVGGSCVPFCSEGFVCVGGACVLNGGQGPVQVTARWNSIEDVDLHLLEPLSAGGTCEIYYGDPNRAGDPSTCGAIGSLDLDSEAGCPSPPDHVDIENIIYPPTVMAPRGTYTVYIDHYANCDASLTWVPFELEARFNGNTVGVCGVFQPTDPDWDNGNATSGRFMMQFTVP